MAVCYRFAMRHRVHIVLGGDIVLEVYSRFDLALRHARCVTGVDIVTCEVLDRLPPEIADDIDMEEWNDSDTPVVSVDDFDDSGGGSASS